MIKRTRVSGQSFRVFVLLFLFFFFLFVLFQDRSPLRLVHAIYFFLLRRLKKSIRLANAAPSTVLYRKKLNGRPRVSKFSRTFFFKLVEDARGLRTKKGTKKFLFAKMFGTARARLTRLLLFSLFIFFYLPLLHLLRSIFRSSRMIHCRNIPG